MRLLVLLFACVCVTTSSLAQSTRQRSPNAAERTGKLTLVAVHVSGSKRFSDAEVIAEAGLKIGDAVAVDDLKTAAERLNETGAFKTVEYKYSFSPRGMTAEFTVEDADQFVPARFDNFVWLPPKELAEKIHGDVPLYHGEVPVRGGLPDEVASTLRTLLAQAGAQGTVNYQLSGTVQEPNKELTYTVEDVRIDVRSVHFPAAPADVGPLLEAAAKPLVGTYYSASRIASVAKFDLLPIFLQRGWLRASFAAPVPHVTQTSPDLAQVDVDLPAEPGLQYRLKDFTFSGFKVLPSQQALKLMHVAPGQAANEIQINKDLHAMKDLYDSRGYIRAKVSASPEYDDSSATVVFALHADEGNQYRMGTFEVEGLDKSSTARLTEAWKLRAGEPYDKTYLRRYLASAASVFPRLDQMNVDVDESADESTQTMDVLLRFKPK